MATRRLPDADPAPADSARRAARAPKSPPVVMPPGANVTPEERRALIARAAYLRAERRGFGPGQETEDWLAAEAEVDALLRVEQRSKQ